MGKYVYGIINSDIQESFDPYGEADEYSGIYTVPYQYISAVVSDSEIVDYTYMNKESLAKLLLWHQQVIERIMRSGHTIIPMKLGTFLQDEIEVKDVLNKGYRLIKGIMEKITGKIEIELVATWNDHNSILKEIADEGEVKHFKEKLLTNPKDIGITDQMKIGIMIQNALECKRKKYAGEIQDALKTIVYAFKTHELMDDKMVINSAFLVNKAESADFYKKVESLNSGFNEKLNFRCIGPLPPYSFYSLEIKKLQFDEVDWARKELCILSGSATKDEIRKAHQKQALSCHPDKNPDSPGMGKKFDEITKAYKVLSDYCVACEHVGVERCSFDKSEFEKNAIVVKIKEL